jgi:hypothetical protein
MTRPFLFHDLSGVDTPFYAVIEISVSYPNGITTEGVSGEA